MDAHALQEFTIIIIIIIIIFIFIMIMIMIMIMIIIIIIFIITCITVTISTVWQIFSSCYTSQILCSHLYKKITNKYVN